MQSTRFLLTFAVFFCGVSVAFAGSTTSLSSSSCDDDDQPEHCRFGCPELEGDCQVHNLPECILSECEKKVKVKDSEAYAKRLGRCDEHCKREWQLGLSDEQCNELLHPKGGSSNEFPFFTTGAMARNDDYVVRLFETERQERTKCMEERLMPLFKQTMILMDVIKRATKAPTEAHVDFLAKKIAADADDVKAAVEPMDIHRLYSAPQWPSNEAASQWPSNEEFVNWLAKKIDEVADDVKTAVDPKDIRRLYSLAKKIAADTDDVKAAVDPVDIRRLYSLVKQIAADAGIVNAAVDPMDIPGVYSAPQRPSNEAASQWPSNEKFDEVADDVNAAVNPMDHHRLYSGPSLEDEKFSSESLRQHPPKRRRGNCGVSVAFAGPTTSLSSSSCDDDEQPERCHCCSELEDDCQVHDLPICAHSECWKKVKEEDLDTFVKTGEYCDEHCKKLPHPEGESSKKRKFLTIGELMRNKDHLDELRQAQNETELKRYNKESMLRPLYKAVKKLIFIIAKATNVPEKQHVTLLADSLAMRVGELRTSLVPDDGLVSIDQLYTNPNW